MSRVLVDTSVLVRYFVGDDPPRSLAAARLVDSRVTLVVTTGNLIELVHALRTSHGMTNPALAASLVRFLTRSNVELVDASRDDVIAALLWSMAVSARRIADAIISAAAEAARVDYIATFDEKMTSPTTPVRIL
jgi:predicted nucleic acid-binding protein